MKRVPLSNKFNESRYYRHLDGTEKWYDHWNRIHREGAPAIIFPDGAEHWIQHGKHHRTDGPAITYPDGRTRWYIDDELINNKKQYQLLTNLTSEELSLLILKYGDIS